MTQLVLDPLTPSDYGTADEFNERFAAIAQVLNKGIDADNIKDGGITAALLASDMLNKQYPVGSLYFNASVNTNPATLLGFGTWASFGAGRTLVGFDGTQTEFNAVQKQGGHKQLQSHTHTGTTSTTGSHSHDFGQDVAFTDNSPRRTSASGNLQAYGFGGLTTGAAGSHNHTFTTDSAGAGDSGNLQPYITVYIWVRTA